jgi:hypothetical protein
MATAGYRQSAGPGEYVPGKAEVRTRLYEFALHLSYQISGIRGNSQIEDNVPPNRTLRILFPLAIPTMSVDLVA